MANCNMTQLSALLLMLLINSAVSVQGVNIGGASAGAPLINALIAGSAVAGISPFFSTNAPDGIRGFKNGSYQIGISDEPMTAAEEAGLKKLTIPQAIITFSLFNGAGRSFKLKANQIANILLGKLLKWESIKGSKLTGNIVFYARSDPAGTTTIFTEYLSKAVPSWPANFVGIGPFTFGNPNIIYVKGSSAVLAGIKSGTLTLGVLQTGIGLAGGLLELKVQNKANHYVTASGGVGSFQQALPRQQPAPGLSWAGISLVYQTGKTTYPIVSFLYSFYRKHYTPKVKVIVKAFGIYAQSDAGQLLSAPNNFYALPSQYTTASLKALRRL